MKLPYYGPYRDADTYDRFGLTVKAYKAASDRDSSSIPNVDVKRVVVSEPLLDRAERFIANHPNLSMAVTGVLNGATR